MFLSTDPDSPGHGSSPEVGTFQLRALVVFTIAGTELTTIFDAEVTMPIPVLASDDVAAVNGSQYYS